MHVCPSSSPVLRVTQPLGATQHVKQDAALCTYVTIYPPSLHVYEGIYMRGCFLPKFFVPSILTRHHNPVYDMLVAMEVIILSLDYNFRWKTCK